MSDFKEIFTNKENDIIQTLSMMAADLYPVRSSRIVAAVALRGYVIAYGMNSLHTHPFQKKFGKNESAQYWHAETNAIHNALRRVTEEELQRASLYVVRMKHTGGPHSPFTWGMAKPCSGCQRCIDTYKIKSLTYSTENGFVRV